MVSLSWNGMVPPRRKTERHKVNDAWCLIQPAPCGECQHCQELCVLREHGAIERALGHLIRKEKSFCLIGEHAFRGVCVKRELPMERRGRRYGSAVEILQMLRTAGARVS